MVTITVSATDALGATATGIITATQSSLNDGSSAPGGAFSNPSLLNGYGGAGRNFNNPNFQPTWNVAGVDYKVGPRSTPIKNPLTQTPVGCSVNTNSHTFFI